MSGQGSEILNQVSNSRAFQFENHGIFFLFAFFIFCCLIFQILEKKTET